MKMMDQSPDSGRIIENPPNIIAGYPKTGRTWLRYMIANALVQDAGIDLDVDFNNIYSIVPNDNAGLIDGQPLFQYAGYIPKIEMTHKPYDEVQHAEANRIFLTRDPRDVMVSHWMHNKNQIKVFAGDLTEFIREEQSGIDRFVKHLDSWSSHLEPEEVLTYEQMRIDPVTALKKVLRGFRVAIPEIIIKDVVANSTFDKMAQKELERGIAGHAYDRTNPEALRIRRGKVGGFSDYLTGEDIAFIDERIRSAPETSQRIIALTGFTSTNNT